MANRNKKDIEDLKDRYGEVVLNTALINLLKLGKVMFDETTLKEQNAIVTSTFEKLKESKQNFPLAKEFCQEVLNCEFELCEFDDLDLLTYFSNQNKANNKEYSEE